MATCDCIYWFLISNYCNVYSFSSQKLELFIGHSSLELETLCSPESPQALVGPLESPGNGWMCDSVTSVNRCGEQWNKGSLTLQWPPLKHCLHQLSNKHQSANVCLVLVEFCQGLFTRKEVEGVSCWLKTFSTYVLTYMHSTVLSFDNL